jgi:Leucine-rich repeat (LRR) protein
MAYAMQDSIRTITIHGVEYESNITMLEYGAASENYCEKTNGYRIPNKFPGDMMSFTNLISLTCSVAYYNTLGPLPPTLEYLKCSRNCIMRIVGELPRGLKTCILRGSVIAIIDNLPEQLLEYDISYSHPFRQSELMLDTTSNEIDDTQIIHGPIIYPLPRSIIILRFSHIETWWNGCDDFSIQQQYIIAGLLGNLPPKLEILECTSNGIKELPSLPHSLRQLLIGHNDITELPDLTHNKSLEMLDCCRNTLVRLCNLPDSITVLRCSENPMLDIARLPSNLTHFDCCAIKNIRLPPLPYSLIELDYSYTNIEIADFPPLLQILFCTNNNLIKIPTGLPDQLKRLICYENMFENLLGCPPNLLVLLCYSCSLHTLDGIPPSIIYLDCHNNDLHGDAFAAVHNGNIEYINCSSNTLMQCDYMPNGLQTLKADDCEIIHCNYLPWTITSLCCRDNYDMISLDYLPYNIRLIHPLYHKRIITHCANFPPNLAYRWNSIHALPPSPKYDIFMS